MLFAAQGSFDVKPDARSCIVALTHDPKLDDLALLDEEVHSAAFYVGAIGSRRNNHARRERMMEHFGETEASLAQLRGPIGLYIDSKTPAEILAVKNAVSLPLAMSVEVPKHEQDMAMNEAGTHCTMPQLIGPASAAQRH